MKKKISLKQQAEKALDKPEIMEEDSWYILVSKMLIEIQSLESMLEDLGREPRP